MQTSQAIVRTEKAERYVLQLCNHWGHRFAVTQGEKSGEIDFVGSGCSLVALPEGLKVTVIGPADEMAGLKDVVAEHLQRFAHKEGALVFNWSDAA